MICLFSVFSVQCSVFNWPFASRFTAVSSRWKAIRSKLQEANGANSPSLFTSAAAAIQNGRRKAEEDQEKAKKC
jgi:hypothetical protein